MMKTPSLLKSANLKRKTPKVQVFARAKVGGQVIIHNEEHLFIAPMDNLSAGGVFIEKLVCLEPGASVRLVIKSPKLGEVIQAHGTVVRIEKDSRKGLAVEFTVISDECRGTIQTCVSESRVEDALKVA